jgi:prepilin-type N-terminal cleavage/methylation domain-containing protein
VNARGVTLAELMLVLALIGILSALATPTILSYVQVSALQASARHLATVINLGRQIAISQNTAVCVHVIDANVRLRRDGCGGPIWSGPGTDGAGVIRIADGGKLVISATADIVFSNLGAASPAGTYTITNVVDGRTLKIVVAATGRISIH